MKMMTKELEAVMPALYSTDGTGYEAIAYAHYFSPFANLDWYMTEYDPETRTGFGLVYGFYRELGYFSIAEFESMGIAIERDLYWSPKSLRKIAESREEVM